jgi:acyl-CoA dehydrogenase
MGFIEESGAAQYLRDARITTIYEGTTGIQANDLIGRKLARDDGQALSAALDDMRATARRLAESQQQELVIIGRRFLSAIDALEEATGFAVETLRENPREALAGAVPFLELAGIVCGGAQLARSAHIAARMLEAGDGDAKFLRAKIATARHFADHCLTHAPALRDTVVHGAAGVLALAEEVF